MKYVVKQEGYTEFMVRLKIRENILVREKEKAKSQAIFGPIIVVSTNFAPMMDTFW